MIKFFPSRVISVIPLACFIIVVSAKPVPSKVVMAYKPQPKYGCDKKIKQFLYPSNKIMLSESVNVPVTILLFYRKSWLVYRI